MRLIASLAVVVGLMLLLARLVGKRYGGRAGAPVQVLHRQPLSRGSSVALVAVGSRVLVLGATDQQVTLLTELDPDDLDDFADLPDLGEAEEPVVLDGAAPDPTPVTAPVPVRGLAALTSVGTGAAGGAHRASAPTRGSASDTGGLAGSVLSPQTWRQAFAAATGKAS